MTNVSEVTAGAALLALLFFLAVAVRTWVGVDAARHNRNWFAWAIALELLSVFALGGWLFSRRRSQPAQCRARRVLLRHGRPAEQQLRQPPLGLRSKKCIVGRVVYRWWPLARARSI